MYVSLNSPYQLTKWSSSGGDPCGESWKGVTCSGLAVTEIVLSGLGLSGSMGYQLASLTSVINFDVSNNNLGDQLPYQLPPNLQRLNIAGNGFNGSLPYSISLMTSLKYLNVSHNQFQYQLTDMFSSLVALSTLDLSFNLLVGTLPTSFSSLSSVTTLYLQNNQFTGTIDVLANLPLENLNVANNQFTGWIPQQLININIQKDGNSWSSEASPPPPPGTPPFIQTSPPPKSGNSNVPSKYDGGGGRGGGGGNKSNIGGGGIAGVVITFFIVGTIVAVILMKRRSRATTSDEEKDHQPLAPLVSNKGQGTKTFQTSLSVGTKTLQTSLSVGTKTFKSPGSINLRPPPLDRHKTFDDEDFRKKPVLTKKASIAHIDAKSYSVADLQIATNSFSTENLIGEGSFGRVYRAQFDGGKVLAVKKISLSVLSNSEDFIGIVLNMSKLDHPNVTKLVGYCSEHGQHLLVHVFHKNGSLHDFLHLPDEHIKPLLWNSRIRIALGTARALEYLHEVCSPSVVHKNLKSANILLGKDLSPHLADCGLASFLPNADQEVGSGYSAPEATMSGIYTLKSDIYSFGVVMLELLTGRKPFDSSRQRAEQSLVGWATPQLHDIDALAKMVDPSLEGLYQVKSLSRFADVIALCVQSEPEFRPPMSEVVQSLVRLVQRAKMGKSVAGTDQVASQLGESPDYK